MTKFEKVKKALQEKTRGSANYITITTALDCRHKGKKYAIKNIITQNTLNEAYKTLNEIIQKYDLYI